MSDTILNVFMKWVGKLKEKKETKLKTLKLDEEFAKEIYELPKNEQQAFMNRLKRRKESNILDKLEFDCGLDELQEVAAKKFNEYIKTSKKSSIHYFKLILNSLHAFFAKQHNSSKSSSKQSSLKSRSNCSLSKPCSNCNKSVSDFLQAYFKKFESSFVPVVRGNANASDLAYRQRELIVLLHMHLLRHKLHPVAELNFFNYLRYIYFNAGPDRLRNFLETTLCDEFFLDLPFCILSVYDELSMLCPDDFERYKTVENDDEDDFTYENQIDDSKNLLTRFNKFIESVKVDYAEEEEKKQAPPLKAEPSSKKTASKSLTARVFPESPVKCPPKFSASTGPNVVKDSPKSKANFQQRSLASDNNLRRRYFLQAEENSPLMSNRKRVRNSSVQQVSTKKQKLIDTNAKMKFKLNILFEAFE